MRKACLLILVIALTASGSRLAAQENGTLSGSVLDHMGAAMPNSQVSIRWNDLGEPMSWDGVHRKHKKPRKKELTVWTDSGGHFSVPLLAGTWDVFAYHDGFVPVCTVRGVEARQTTNVELRFPRLVQTTME
jgi:uncharacterized GH25 family protein